jgi:hypothetical protein|nr:MAG TPA: activating signal cointegrator [Caudoviricetes sp.]
MAKIIEIKIAPEHFADVKRGVKKAELRYNDRNYEVGDLLVLREYAGGEYTGRRYCVTITHILQNCGFGLLDGWAMLSIKPFKEAKRNDKKNR